MNALIGAIGTLLVGVFTYFIWRLNQAQFRRTHFAQLNDYAHRAIFVRSSGQLRVEVLLGNSSAAPAIVQSWKLKCTEGNNSHDISAFQTCPTHALTAPAFIGNIGWVIDRETPVALSIMGILNFVPRTDDARVHWEVTYAGGGDEPTSLKGEIKVERTA